MVCSSPLAPPPHPPTLLLGDPGLTAMAPADSDDSDDSTEYTTNRGNKLKRTARFVKKGRLTSSNGPAAYKEVR